MVKPPRKWDYILIELEIDGIVIDCRIASRLTFNGFYAYLRRCGQLQTLPWAVFISRSKYLRPRVIPDTRWQNRDKHGRYIKTDKEELLQSL